MKSFLTIIKLDYLQRTRNYNFLITLCASLAIAYTFVPEPNANYSTIRISDYIGFYNSAWFGYVTAIMSSIFLSLIGFYLVNSGVKNDIETKVGQMIASTQTTNFAYLISKTIGNFLLLLTIVCIIFIMSIVLFFLYNDGYPFQIVDFIKPYLIITVPAMFFVASLAVFFEVILAKYQVLQNVVFFFLFCALIAFTPKNKDEFAFDAFGSKIVMYQLEDTVRTLTNTDKTTSMSIGYVLGNTKKANKFEFNGVQFSSLFLISRFFWILISFGLVFLSSKVFHRFSINKKVKSIKKLKIIDSKIGFKEINLSTLIEAKTNYSIFSLIKTEFLLLVRKGKKWLWFVNISGMILLGFLSLEMAHKIVLPILWFLQVHRISDIATKEKSYNMHLFASSSYKPIQRIFASKIIASLLLMFIISLPLILKYSINFEILNAGFIVLGFVFLTFSSILLGQITKGKKLFEVTFFLVTYANINEIPFFDYFGAIKNDLGNIYTILIIILLLLGTTIFLKRKSVQK
ncbi:hypothetical protein [Polaribacter porphyrae]|uniref:Uncharacterized protein n=1 Tax=Polaribacter porphyrae TaxID=1137780 RepID=A0A2S7WR94_9FLAO|nr:hypothetical protein [Polaribacter porphyrae]PQJ80110.1 hypothetical protein BTO18_13410 [Polaribacter porphyrae]